MIDVEKKKRFSKAYMTTLEEVNKKSKASILYILLLSLASTL